MARKVFIVNNSSHDFTSAKKFGELVFLSEGPMSRYATNSMVRDFTALMVNSSPSDYIVPCSLNVMNSIACAIFACAHGRLNLLLFKDGQYIERNHILTKGLRNDN
jgi:hypothetical protein